MRSSFGRLALPIGVFLFMAAPALAQLQNPTQNVAGSLYYRINGQNFSEPLMLADH
jgi:hypothetical protein